jgi:hypothetical protein
MKIDTDDWLMLREACAAAKMPQATGYRLAKNLGIVQVIFGTRVVRKSDIPKMVANKKRVGNPMWIESYEEAAASALRAVASRKRREKQEARAAKRVAT